MRDYVEQHPDDGQARLDLALLYLKTGANADALRELEKLPKSMQTPAVLYYRAQACRALKEEGCSVILLNSNPATIQTDDSVADHVYIRPLLPYVVESILKEHRPDGVVATLGGQTGLNLCMECEKLGMWRRYKCRVLGTQPEAIERAVP